MSQNCTLILPAVFPVMNPPLPKRRLIYLQLKKDCANSERDVSTATYCEGTTFNKTEESAYFDGASYIMVHNNGGNLRLGSRGFTIQFRMRLLKNSYYHIFAYERSQEMNYAFHLLNNMKDFSLQYRYRKRGENGWSGRHVS